MSPEDPLAPSIRYRWTVLVMLTLVYTFNFIDRQILVILQEPIKADLGLSDAQLGLLSGFSFALVYVTAGIPIAWLADRGNRRNIVAVSLGFLELHDRSVRARSELWPVISGADRCRYRRSRWVTPVAFDGQ
jgi:MFS family permease